MHYCYVIRIVLFWIDWSIKPGRLSMIRRLRVRNKLIGGDILMGHLNWYFEIGRIYILVNRKTK